MFVKKFTKTAVALSAVTLSSALLMFACSDDGDDKNDGNNPPTLVMCGDIEINTATHFCFEGSPLEKCGGREWNPHNQICDRRTPEQAYKFVTIGNQIWLAENLNYRNAAWNNDGTNTGSNPFPVGDKGSWCYSNNSENCAIYGRLYTWDAAMDNACPVGWSLPEVEDFHDLILATGGTIDGNGNISDGASIPLLSETVTEGTNESGFSLLLSGQRYPAGSYDRGNNYLWTSTPHGGNENNAMFFRYRTTGTVSINSAGTGRNTGAAVRCIKD